MSTTALVPFRRGAVTGRLRPIVSRARTAALGLVVHCAITSPASAIRNGVPELGVEYNGVGMFLPAAGHPLSTGVMVSQFVVLTAAQNVQDPSPDAAVYEFTLGSGTAHATEIRVHPEFDSADGLNLTFDVALVALDREKVQHWSGITRPAFFASLPPIANPVKGVGFGETQTGLGSGVRRSGNFTVTRYLEGADSIGLPVANAFIEVTPEDMLNQMFCPGDHGGPLFYKDRLAGVASFRFVAACDSEGPGYYVNLHRFTGWIRENLAEMDPFLADFQEDFDVDGGDLTAWQGGFGASIAATHMQGDADGDRDVDGADFLTWQRQLGITSAQSAANAVPEPAGWMLCVVGMLALRLLRLESPTQADSEELP